MILTLNQVCHSLFFKWFSTDERSRRSYRFETMDYELTYAEGWQLSTSSPKMAIDDDKKSDESDKKPLNDDSPLVDIDDENSPSLYPKDFSVALVLAPSNALVRYSSSSPTRSTPTPSTPQLPLPIGQHTHTQVPPPDPPQPVPSNRPVKSLVRNKENEAKAAFRATKNYTAVFKLPKSCLEMSPDRKIMLRMLEDIGVQCGSFIRPPQSQKDRVLHLWGNPSQTIQTSRELSKWVAASEVPSHPTLESRLVRITRIGNQFAKVSAAAEDSARLLDRQVEDEALVQAYQSKPEESDSFLCTGYHLWPVDEIRPEELLGPNLEALDPLRRLHRSYILFDESFQAMKVSAINVDVVNEVMDAIEGTYKEFVARSGKATTVYLVERPDQLQMRKEVRMVEGPLSGSEKAQVPSLTGASLVPAEITKWVSEGKILEDLEISQLRQTVEKGLQRLRFYRGRVQMRALLGTFALTTFRRWPPGVEKISVQRFRDELQLPATKGRLIRV